MAITRGVLQGSVLGPTLWNVFYVDLHSQETPLGLQLIGFADDLAIVATSRIPAGLEAIINPILEMVDVWTRSHGLSLAHYKTDAIILSRKRKYEVPALIVGGVPIPIKKEIKYLDVVLDSHLSFRKHIEISSSKALQTASALADWCQKLGVLVI